MNGAYVHLVINHIPIVTVPVCFLLLLSGAVQKSRDVVQAGFVGLVLSALIAVPVWYSGGPAAGVLHNTPGVTIAQGAIHEHAEAAEFGVVEGVILGVLGLVGWWLGRRPQGAPKGFVIFMIVASLFVSTVMARVAHLGGLIRHPEIASQ
jgi:hypothetical protein